MAELLLTMFSIFKSSDTFLCYITGWVGTSTVFVALVKDFFLNTCYTAMYIASLSHIHVCNSDHNDIMDIAYRYKSVEN